VRGFDTMKILRAAVKNEVIVCVCNGCKFEDDGEELRG
jgi:hypothetical protein